MKISPTILNSSSALGLGSVSQCALGRQGEGLVRDEGRDPHRRGPCGETSGEGSETPMGGIELSRVIWPFR